MPDVVSVPEAAGREALARLLGYGQPAVAPGPVALSAGGRVLFYVADGGAQDLPELLEWLDWGGVRLDLTAVTEAELADPPVRWLHPATVPMQAVPTPAVPIQKVPTVPTVQTVETVETVQTLPTRSAAARRPDTPDAGAADGTNGASRRPDVAGITPDGVERAGVEEAGAGADRDGRGGSRRDAYPTPGLPEPPELIALLATIAAACHRLAVAAAR